MAGGIVLRLSFPRFFNKPWTEIATMTALRSLLFLTASAVAALAQAVPAVPPGTPTRSGDVVMMQPIPDGSTDAGLPGLRPSHVRVLSATDHDLFVRAFEAVGRG